ncbi:uncharacterized protein LOC143886913 [Tasmannia lanceolata]|uniref:uncharacterized protein LOC143886913 n=1 Tax=Tasmannia lanceolata TaxID=3420 RepID=UPI004062EE2A
MSTILRNQMSPSHSNLGCFIHSATPTVPSHILPKSCLRDINNIWQPVDKETMEYFTLGDLWDRYGEWSAYGIGTPILLNNGDTVIQYYVPYLSALQIYTNKSFATFRNLREERDAAEFESDSWSDDSESDKLSRSLSNNSSRAWDATSEDSSFEQEGSWPMRDRLGYVYFQYFEGSAPYGRIPLMDKIIELARCHPGLMSLKSVELSPASWMAVAWYPIYHIPTGRNVKELSACFLTYHTLSSSFQDNVFEGEDKNICRETEVGELKCERDTNGISLPPFGLATYKMHGNLWMHPESADQERIISLFSAADSWLKQLDVQHHDFNYFSSHSSM